MRISQDEGTGSKTRESRESSNSKKDLGRSVSADCLPSRSDSRISSISLSHSSPEPSQFNVRLDEAKLHKTCFLLFSSEQRKNRIVKTEA
ncbi:Hypothetical protein NTJ_05534 [Nesidiocoris tenuis]|uniref:Uncharacterized protein n=1 Tax=Nesidiocoris tenuis TaxID=355587 RepID=A0ABN7AKE6_9HEMI|nr:Hypothetical protein NTJ_05534 [Nesidiocoris tenuis]